MKILILSIALLALGSCKSKVNRARECENFAAETGNPIYRGREDCRVEIAAFYAEKKKRMDEGDRLARIAAERARKSKAEATAASPEDARRLVSLFLARVCEDLAQSTSQARFAVTIREYAGDIRIYSIRPDSESTAPPPETVFSTADGKPYCTEGGASGGDCVDRLSDKTRKNMVVREGTVAELTRDLGCAETEKARAERPPGPSRSGSQGRHLQAPQ